MIPTLVSCVLPVIDDRHIIISSIYEQVSRMNVIPRRLMITARATVAPSNGVAAMTAQPLPPMADVHPRFYRSAASRHHRSHSPNLYNIVEPLKNPFLVYLNERYDVVKQLHPNMTITDIVTRLSDNWQCMTAEERKPFIEHFLVSQTGEHVPTRADYKSFLTAEEVRAIREEELYRERVLINKIETLNRKLCELKEDQPVPPPAAFHIFSRAYIKGVKGSLDEKVQAAAVAWEEMAEGEKKGFQDEVYVMRNKYAKEMADWEETILEDGRMQEILALEEEINTLRELEETISRARVADWFQE